VLVHLVTLEPVTAFTAGYETCLNYRNPAHALFKAPHLQVYKPAAVRLFFPYPDVVTGIFTGISGILKVAIGIT
jgi:hypothetical protein